MSDKPHYPPLTDVSLAPFRALEAQLGQYPDLFERADCPYPQHIRGFLAQMLGHKAEEAGPFSDDDLLAETTELYRELQRTVGTLKSSDAKDQMAIFKTQTDLLTKLMGLREKAMNIREMSRFQKLVMDVLDGLVTPAQRSEFIEKLGKYVDVQ